VNYLCSVYLYKLFCLTFNICFNSSYIYILCIQYQACVYRTQAQFDRSHVLLTEMLQTEAARAILSVECITAVENFQVVLKEKQQYVAHHVRLGNSLTRHAASTSPVESMIVTSRVQWDVLPTQTKAQVY
jgi:hypothetical protein